MAMSLSLGPIHYWIFDQVGLVERRSETLAARLAEELDESVADLWTSLLDRFPDRYADGKLEDLVDRSIHGSLDGMIAAVEGREAALVAGVVERWADSGRELLQRLFAEEGAAFGQRSRSLQEGGADAREVFGALRELWLEGMPCDVKIAVAVQEPRRVEWVRDGLPLDRYWTASGANLELMFDLHCRWQKAFVLAHGDRFRYEVLETPFRGNEAFRFAIENANSDQEV
jgi:hypothetical protein